MVHPSRRRCAPRAGASAVEFALLLPFLAFMFVVAVDFARIFYFSVTVMNCARNGALWACDPVNATQTASTSNPYTSVEEAALADASNLNPKPTVTTTYGVDASGAGYVEVTVRFQFQTLTNYPGIPKTFNLERTVRMQMIPTVPSF